jgi:proteasome alpha subunit
MDNIKEHQSMGYDRAVSIFSPDGLILQIEYAEKAVKLGAPVMAITTKEGVVFFGDRKIRSKLLIKESFKKVFEIDENIFVVGSGVMSDGRRLIEQSQIIAQEHRIKFENEIDILSLVKDIANIKQYYSQSGGYRPFGVSLLIGGFEGEKAVLYQTTPSGMYLKYLARAVGSNSDDLNKYLEENYKENLTNDKAIELGIKAFEEVFKNDFNKDRLDIVSLTKKEVKRI